MPKILNIELSPLKEAYMLLDVTSPGDLSENYTKEDQKLAVSEKWDYKNNELLINRIKNIIEKSDFSKMSDDEKYWAKNILWFWYHHAITCSIWKYFNKHDAQHNSEMALKYQDKNHPNKITRLLYFLVRDDLKNAISWLDEITTEPEKSTAVSLLKSYKNGEFFRA